MSFEVLQKRLREEGWFVEWKMPCCQSCAWAEVEHDDLSRVLFNHEQDCEKEDEECEYCEGEGYIMECHDSDGEETEEDCMNCDGAGYHTSYYETGDEAKGSYFCFDGSKEGVKNLKAILPIIKECGCEYYWDGSGATRIEITW